MIYSFIFTILFLFFSNNYKQKIFLVSSVFFLFFLKYFIYQSLELPFLLQGETYNKSIFGFEYKVLFERFFLVSKYYLMFLLDNLLMLISLISLTIIVVFVKNPKYLKFFLLFFFLNLNFIYGSHLFMNLKNIDYWITHTIPRFMLQTTGFYLLAFLIFCNIRFSKFLK